MNRDELNRRLHEEMTDVRVSPALRGRTLLALRGKERIMKRKWTVALAAALLAVLLCAVALAAVGRWGMLDFIGRYQNTYIPQDAGDYVQSDVAAFAQDGLAVNVRELYYDGRTARMTVDVTATDADTLLLGEDTQMDDAWGGLTGQAGDARTVLDVWHARGEARVLRVGLHTADVEQGAADASLDWVLGEDGVLTWYIEQRYDDDRPAREVTLTVTATPYADPEAGEESLDWDRRAVLEKTLTLTADGDTDIFVSAEPAVYADAGVRVDCVRIEVKLQELVATVEFTVIDEAAFAATDDGLWFEFIDPQSTETAYASQRLTGGLSGSDSVEDLGGGRYVQTETLAKNELRDTYTLRAYNCWEKNRYETHEFIMQPQP